MTTRTKNPGGRPPLSRKSPTKLVAFRIPEDDLRAVREAAGRDSEAACIRDVLAAGLAALRREQ